MRRNDFAYIHSLVVWDSGVDSHALYLGILWTGNSCVAQNAIEAWLFLFVCLFLEWIYQYTTNVKLKNKRFVWRRHYFLQMKDFTCPGHITKQKQYERARPYASPQILVLYKCYPMRITQINPRTENVHLNLFQNKELNLQPPIFHVF